MATIKQLAERKAKLEVELSEVNAEIAARAGETDAEPVTATKAVAKRATATKKAAG